MNKSKSCALIPGASLINTQLLFPIKQQLIVCDTGIYAIISIMHEHDFGSVHVAE